MHTRTLAILLACLIISACSSDSPAGSDADIPFVESALRLELSGERECTYVRSR